MLPRRDILSFSSFHCLDQQTYSKSTHKSRLLWELVSIIKPSILHKANKRTREENHFITLKIYGSIKTSQSLESMKTFLGITNAQGYTKKCMKKNMPTCNKSLFVQMDQCGHCVQDLSKLQWYRKLVHLPRQSKI